MLPVPQKTTDVLWIRRGTQLAEVKRGTQGLEGHAAAVDIGSDRDTASSGRS